MKLISSKRLLKTSIFKVTMDQALDPEGFEIKRAIIQHRGSAVMMAVDADRRMLLVKQYRLPARSYMWELPAGRMDAGETALQAARRELREETGYRATSWKKLAHFYVSPGFLAETMTIYLATGLTAGEVHFMQDERIERKWFQMEEVDAMIRSGEIVDAKTMVGFFSWQRYHKGGM
ncbi:MAG: NUDIX hydrolase [Bryobacteraceae bacterium]|nr:NUDIX hydrolase [Bryobacteraceae bacterium]